MPWLLWVEPSTRRVADGAPAASFVSCQATSGFLAFQLLITISGTLSPSMSWRNAPSFSLVFVSARRCRRHVWPFVRPSAPGFW